MQRTKQLSKVVGTPDRDGHRERSPYSFPPQKLELPRPRIKCKDGILTMAMGLSVVFMGDDTESSGLLFVFRHEHGNPGILQYRTRLKIIPSTRLSEKCIYQIADLMDIAECDSLILYESVLFSLVIAEPVDEALHTALHIADIVGIICGSVDQCRIRLARQSESYIPVRSILCRLIIEILASPIFHQIGVYLGERPADIQSLGRRIVVEIFRINRTVSEPSHSIGQRLCIQHHLHDLRQTHAGHRITKRISIRMRILSAQRFIVVSGIGVFSRRISKPLSLTSCLLPHLGSTGKHTGKWRTRQIMCIDGGTGWLRLSKCRHFGSVGLSSGCRQSAYVCRYRALDRMRRAG